MVLGARSRTSKILDHRVKAMLTSRSVCQDCRGFEAHKIASHWKYTDHSGRVHTFVLVSRTRILCWELHMSSTSYALRPIHPTVIRSSTRLMRPNCRVVATYLKMAVSGRISSRMMLSASPQPPFCIPCRVLGMSSRKPLFREKWIPKATSQAYDGPRPRCRS